MKLALEVSLDIDLSLFSQYLWQQRITHRINESGDNQVLWVASEADIETVKAFYTRFSTGEMRLQKIDQGPAEAPVTGSKRLALVVWSFIKLPVTLSVILLTVLLYPISWGVDQNEFSDWFRLMTFVPFDIGGRGLLFATVAETFNSLEYWRLLTPMFIHFSLLHIVFNLLWFWELGRRVETRLGGAELTIVILASSLCANVAQYMLSGPSLFGGMSGVVFGLLGFTLVWSRLLPSRTIALPDGVYIFMFVFLALGFAGIIDLLPFGNMANGAHLGGLLAGLILGFAFAMLEKGKTTS